MSFTRKGGNRLIANLLSTWAVCAVAGWVVSLVADSNALNAFIVIFAVGITALVVVCLGRRDFLSALLLVGGGLIAFSLTVVLFKLLGL